MKRIAVIFEGRLHDQMGVFNAVMQRVRHLRDIAQGCAIDVHMIEGYDRGLNRWLHGTRRIADRPAVAHIDTGDVRPEGRGAGAGGLDEGIDVQVHWFCHSLMDTVRHKLLHRPALSYRRWLSRLADGLQGYDLLSAHDRIAGTAAAMAGHRFGMPHYITWHGHSIHSDAATDPVYRAATIELLQHATCNFFVSRGLERFARETLCDEFRSEVLYNGASPAFFRYDEVRRRALRHQRGIGDDERVVGFVGRMDAVKNVTLLDDLFDEVSHLYHGGLHFVAVGDGPLHDQVRQLLHERGIRCLMPGAVPYAQMPDWMNCIDVLVLPSQKEGLPLVALEAIQCGANVVATDVLGTAEAVGAANAIALDDDLIDNMSRRVAQLLQGNVIQQLPPAMSWAATARREWQIYQGEPWARHS